ncbi:aldo-keto reductase [Blastocladiella britannica]|nr:aldo-keto reductase [Blastocladiella britannica]
MISMVNSCPIPMVGLGTYRMGGDQCYTAVMEALALGYRHIDTAAGYRNEAEVGRALADAITAGLVTRNDVFITSKIAPGDQGEDRAHAAVQRSLQQLGIAKIDLMLIHWPGAGGKPPGSPENATLRAGTWRALERHVREGTIAHIGVSNYLVPHLEALWDMATIKPAVLQMELHPWYVPSDVIAWCQSHKVAVEAYSSLGEGKLVDPSVAVPEADAVAKRTGATRAQVLLAWARAHGWITLPKSTSAARLRENLASTAVELTPDEVLALDALAARNQKFCWDPSMVA